MQNTSLASSEANSNRPHIEGSVGLQSYKNSQKTPNSRETTVQREEIELTFHLTYSLFTPEVNCFESSSLHTEPSLLYARKQKEKWLLAWSETLATFPLPPLPSYGFTKQFKTQMDCNLIHIIILLIPFLLQHGFAFHVFTYDQISCLTFHRQLKTSKQKNNGYWSKTYNLFLRLQ